MKKNENGTWLLILAAVALVVYFWPTISNLTGLAGQGNEAAGIVINVVNQAEAQNVVQPPPAPAVQSAPSRYQRDMDEVQGAILALGENLAQCQRDYGADACGQIEGQIAFMLAQQRALEASAEGK